MVKAKDNKIAVTFYGNYKAEHKMAVESLLRKLDASCRNLPVSWRGNRTIAARFKYGCNIKFIVEIPDSAMH